MPAFLQPGEAQAFLRGFSGLRGQHEGHGGELILVVLGFGSGTSINLIFLEKER